MLFGMRITVVTLLCGAACGAAVAPEKQPEASRADLTHRLAELVSSMAAGQQTSAPKAEVVSLDDEAVIVEALDGNRRSLGRCRCDDYHHAAAAGMDLCAKVESGRTICTPQHNNRCKAEEVKCSGRGDRPAASPQPSAGGDFSDAELQELGDVYINANFQISPEGGKTLSMQGLPTAEQFVTALAEMTRLSRSNIHVITSWDFANDKVRAAATRSVADRHLVTTAGDEAMLHATFAIASERRRDALEALLQVTELLHIGGVTYKVNHVTILEHATHPLVCNAEAETVKAEAALLLQQLVALKQAEVELLQTGLAKSQNTTACDGAALHALNTHIHQ